MTGIEQVWDRPWPWSIWSTIVMAVIAAVVVGFLYFSERGRASAALRGLLATLRLFALMLVWWMLAGWNVQRFHSDLPELVLVVDDSASMETADGGANSVTYSGASSGALSIEDRIRDQPASRWEVAVGLVRQLWQQDRDRARPRYRPRLVALSSEPRTLSGDAEDLTTALAQLQPTGEQSRLGDGLLEILQWQTGKPTAAIVFFSDGIVTSGGSLEEAANQARRLAIPIVCVATGEQLPQPDLALTDLLADDAVVLGDRVNLQVTVTAWDIEARRATVQLRDMQSGQIVDSASAEFSAASDTTGVQLSYVPTMAGSSVIQLEVASAANEKNLENNLLERAIEVRDQTLRILLIQKSPSFEYRFLKTLLERTARQGSDSHDFEVDVVLQDADATHVSQDKHALRLVPGDRETIAAYDVIVVGEIDPSLVASSAQQFMVEHVTKAGCGLMFVCNPGFDPGQWSGRPLASLMPLDATQRGPTPWTFDGRERRWQPTKLGENALPLQLTTASGAEELWHTLPGPQWIYHPGTMKPGAQVLAATAQGDGDTSLPLLISQFVGAGRVVMQTNDETYRWIGYGGSDLTYDRYWIQMLRWLARGKLNAQTQSELSVEPRRVRAGQPLQFSLRLSPEALTGLGDKTATINVERIGGETKPVELTRSQSASAQFKGLETALPPGSYRASVSQPADASVASVTFTVTSPPGEQANLRSDWSALRRLAEESHGKFFIARDVQDLLSQLPKGSPVRRGALPPQPLWNSPWIAAALVILLTLEWVLRRSANML